MSRHLLPRPCMFLLVSVLATAAGAEAPPASATSPAAKTSIEEILSRLRAEGQDTTADKLQKAIAAAQQEQKQRDRGYLMVGRIRLNGGPARPRQINSQLNILDEGWFVTLVEDLYRPISLRLHGYEVLEVPLKGVTPGNPNEVSYLGEVSLSPLPSEKRGTVRGRLVVTAPEAQPYAMAYITQGPINSPGGGGGGYRPAALLRLHVEQDGRFELWDMTPTPARYEFTFGAKEHVTLHQLISVKAGETVDLGQVRLEKPKHLRVRYFLSDKPPPFRGAKPQEAQLAGGSIFQADPKMGGYTFFYQQEPGRERLKFFHYPCELARVGKGTLEKFRGVEPSKLEFRPPLEEPFEPGVVYLVNHVTFKHWVLFQVEYVDDTAK